jgi:hypothetical protein
MVAISANNPMDVFATNQSSQTNLTGASLPMFPGDMFIDRWWVNNGVYDGYINHISRCALLTSYSTELNINLMTCLSASSSGSYEEMFSLLNRQTFQNIANFWGYTALGYAVDDTLYGEGSDTTVQFYDFNTINPTITPAMLQYFQVINNSVRRMDSSNTIMTIDADLSSVSFNVPAG